MSTVFLKLLNMSITAGWLILAVLAARILLKKAPRWIACLLWGLVALRLLCPYSLKSALSLIPSAETIPTNVARSANPAIHSGIPVVNAAVNPIIEKTFSPEPFAGVNPLQIWISAAAAVWMLGLAAMLVYAWASYLRLRKTVAASVPIKDRVMACDEIKTPFILGVIRPKIYIPSSMCGETLDCVLLHETAHLKRRDHWWKPFGFLLLAVYWFNPLCWLAYILLCRDIEAACDEKVVRDMDRDGVATYSQALLDCSFPRKRIAACPLAFGEVGVKQRIKGVLNYRRPAFWIILIAVVICIAIVVCFMTDPLSIDSTARDIVQDNIQALCSEGYPEEGIIYLMDILERLQEPAALGTDRIVETGTYVQHFEQSNYTEEYLWFRTGSGQKYYAYLQKSSSIIFFVCKGELEDGAYIYKTMEGVTGKSLIDRDDPVIPFTITIEETERYHFMELKITDGQVLNSFSNQTQYLFTVVSRADHRITLSCDEWIENGAQEKTLFLSIRDSTLQTYVTITFQNVVLHDNAHIILSNDGSAMIIVKADTGETTYSGFISQIS